MYEYKEETKTMTTKEKQQWLEKASPEELMAYYGGLNASMARVGTPVEKWVEMSQDKLMAEKEIMKRLKKAEEK